MGKGMSILLMLVVLMAVSVGSQQAGPSQQPVQSHVAPLKKFAKLAMDKRYETVSGDPAKAGAPFVIRIHAEAGYIIMPHTHPEDENIVVVKGSWALGMGDRFSRGTLEPWRSAISDSHPRKWHTSAFQKQTRLSKCTESAPLSRNGSYPCTS